MSRVATSSSGAARSVSLNLTSTFAPQAARLFCHACCKSSYDAHRRIPFRSSAQCQSGFPSARVFGAVRVVRTVTRRVAATWPEVVGRSSWTGRGYGCHGVTTVTASAQVRSHARKRDRTHARTQARGTPARASTQVCAFASAVRNALTMHAEGACTYAPRKQVPQFIKRHAGRGPNCGRYVLLCRFWLLRVALSSWLTLLFLAGLGLVSLPAHEI